MKKLKYFLLIITAFISFASNINATCYDDTLNNWAERLKIKMYDINDNYTPPVGLTIEDLPYSYLIMLDNPRSDLRIEARDTYNLTMYPVEYDTDFDNYVIASDVHFMDKTYTLNIYMSDDADTCAGETMRTISYTVPKYNKYNDSQFCEENPDDKICGAYTKVSTTDKIDDIIENYYDKKIDKQIFKNKPWYEKASIILKEYALYVFIPFVIISIVYIIIIIIVKKRREKK